MVLFYADENFSYPVVEALRLLGHDVLTVQEARERGGADAQVLAFATNKSHRATSTNKTPQISRACFGWFVTQSIGRLTGLKGVNLKFTATPFR